MRSKKTWKRQINSITKKLKRVLTTWLVTFNQIKRQERTKWNIWWTIFSKLGKSAPSKTGETKVENGWKMLKLLIKNRKITNIRMLSKQRWYRREKPQRRCDLILELIDLVKLDNHWKSSIYLSVLMYLKYGIAVFKMLISGSMFLAIPSSTSMLVRRVANSPYNFIL